MTGTVQIRCGACGRSDDFEAFCRANGQELRRGVFRCPGCGLAVERRIGPSKRYSNGFVVPGPVSLVEVDA